MGGDREIEEEEKRTETWRKTGTKTLPAGHAEKKGEGKETTEQ